MNICIVTVYNSINVGSYWQARALGDVLRANGNKVYYFKNSDRTRILIDEFKRAAIYFLQRKFSDSIRHLISIFSFLRHQKYFNVISKKSKLYDRMDLFIFGSDTIWNISDKYFKKEEDIFWGIRFPLKRKCSYAVSVSNTDKSLFFKTDKYKKALTMFDRISVRDEKSKSVVENLISRDARVVCDPSLLMGIDDYKKIISCNIRIKDPYILVYIFERMSEKHEEELISFARDKNLKIISAYGRRNVKFAHKVIVDNPYDFLRYFSYAQYVITDTFHGTAFSINFRKRFVSINHKKIPVNNILREYGLESRLINNDDSLTEKLNREIPYDAVDINLKENIKMSKEYLNKVLLSC